MSLKTTDSTEAEHNLSNEDQGKLLKLLESLSGEVKWHLNSINASRRRFAGSDDYDVATSRSMDEANAFLSKHSSEDK
ncbi:hypothetical protein LMH73_016920 [Vibrio splendidus]|nr:hypothetical protein [Vibrio splendidus]MCC4881840.1 hypothetical protein [Vibrio splendidus]